MSDKKPSDFHSDLKEENIINVGALIAAAYHDSLDFYLEDKGDTRWSHGCRRYEWARNNIREAAGTDKAPYLSILRDIGNTFEFKIGDVPVKFKRTNPDEPDDSLIRQSQFEAAQLSMAFPGEPCELRWRIMVEDDYDGEVVRIVFAGLDENKVTKCFWQLPRDRIAAHIMPIDNIKDEGVDLPPATVGVRHLSKKEEKKA